VGNSPPSRVVVNEIGPPFSCSSDRRRQRGQLLWRNDSESAQQRPNTDDGELRHAC
jgi:hypothetical protein